MRKFDIQDRIILDDALDSFLHAAKVHAEEAELMGKRPIVTYGYWKMIDFNDIMYVQDHCPVTFTIHNWEDEDTGPLTAYPMSII